VRTGKGLLIDALETLARNTLEEEDKAVAHEQRVWATFLSCKFDFLSLRKLEAQVANAWHNLKQAEEVTGAHRSCQASAGAGAGAGGRSSSPISDDSPRSRIAILAALGGSGKSIADVTQDGIVLSRPQSSDSWATSEVSCTALYSFSAPPCSLVLMWSSSAEHHTHRISILEAFSAAPVHVCVLALRACPVHVCVLALRACPVHVCVLALCSC